MSSFLVWNPIYLKLFSVSNVSITMMLLNCGNNYIKVITINILDWGLKKLMYNSVIFLGV